jgi:hypothetical protein
MSRQMLLSLLSGPCQVWTYAGLAPSSLCLSLLQDS